MAKKFTWDDVQVVALRDKKYIYGSYAKGSIKEDSEYSSLKTAQEKLSTKLIKPSSWLKTRGLDSSFEKDLFLSLKTEEVYILSPPIEATEKEWQKFWFTHIAEKCNNCINTCKESGFTTILACKNSK